MRKQHAEHNEKLCHHLLSTKEYNDWVVTTAFYSALHYVYFDLFPLKVDGKTYKNFNKYYKQEVKEKGKTFDKHTATIKLVKLENKSIHSYYRWLYEKCRFSRYNDYKVGLDMAEEAKRNLDRVKNGLKKNP